MTKTTVLIENYKTGSGAGAAGTSVASTGAAGGNTSSLKGQEAKSSIAATGGGGGGVNQFPYEYFRRKADEMKDRVKRYRATMDVSPSRR